MNTTYYAVCDAGGPISIELDGETQAEALTAFAALDHRATIDNASTDLEDALGIAGSDMSETEFAAACVAAGATHLRSLAEVVMGDRVYHEAGGWALWAVSDDVQSVSGKNDDGSSWTLNVGDRVGVAADAADPDSADEGKIWSFVDRETAVVGWDSGVSTPIEIARLVSL